MSHSPPFSLTEEETLMFANILMFRLLLNALRIIHKSIEASVSIIRKTNIIDITTTITMVCVIIVAI
jgi:hypothetical protein